MTEERSLQALSLDEPSWEVPAAQLALLSSKRHRYALVIPVINEGERIRRQLRAIADFAPALDVIVADGGSTDGSLDLGYLESCGVRALLVKRGSGQLSAQLRMAYAWVLQEGYEGVVTVDGNGKDGIEALPLFIAALEDGVDYVQGSRYRKGGAAINTPLDRKIAGRLVHAPLLSLAAGQWFSDTTNGFRGYSRRYLLDPEVAPFRAEFDRYSLLFYLTLRAGQLGYNSLEVPVTRSYPAGEKPPTKISGLSGRVSMMSELLRCTFGGCTPQGLRPFSGQGYAASHGSTLRSVPAALLLLTGLFIFASRILPLIHPHDPWLDEAMLMANLPLPDFAALFKPLPLFEQAAPLGYLFLANVTTVLFTEDPALALRGLSVFASLLAAWLLFLVVRRLIVGYAAALALALVCLSALPVIYSVEIKQYIFEYLGAVLMMYAAVRVLQDYSAKSLCVLFVAGLLSILFSFTAPIVIAAVGVGLLVQTWVKAPKGSQPLVQVGTVIALGVLAIVFLINYFAYIRPVTEMQFSAFAPIYDSGVLAVPPRTADELSLWFLFPEFAFTNITADWMRITKAWAPLSTVIILLLFLISLILGLYESLRRFVFLPVTALTATILVYGLSAAALLPITVPRHFAFMVPFLGIILAIGLFKFPQIMIAWRGKALAAWAAAILSVTFVLTTGVTAVVQSTGLARQEVSPLIAFIEEHNESDAPVWVYYGAQPAMRVLEPPNFQQLGEISHASSPTGWVWENRVHSETVHKEKYLREVRNTLRDLPEVWLLFSHYGLIEWDGLILLFSIAEEEVGNCRQVLRDAGSLLWKCG